VDADCRPELRDGGWHCKGLGNVQKHVKAALWLIEVKQDGFEENPVVPAPPKKSGRNLDEKSRGPRMPMSSTRPWSRPNIALWGIWVPFPFNAPD
jgi:hypothetical protein